MFLCSRLVAMIMTNVCRWLHFDGVHSSKTSISWEFSNNGNIKELRGTLLIFLYIILHQSNDIMSKETTLQCIWYEMINKFLRIFSDSSYLQTVTHFPSINNIYHFLLSNLGTQFQNINLGRYYTWICCIYCALACGQFITIAIFQIHQLCQSETVQGGAKQLFQESTTGWNV